MRRECRKSVPLHRGLEIPTCITARAWRTCRDACLDRQLTGWEAHVRNTTHFMKKSWYTLLAGKMDVMSLYANILDHVGLMVVTQSGKKRRRTARISFITSLKCCILTKVCPWLSRDQNNNFPGSQCQQFYYNHDSYVSVDVLQIHHFKVNNQKHLTSLDFYVQLSPKFSPKTTHTSSVARDMGCILWI